MLTPGQARIRVQTADRVCCAPLPRELRRGFFGGRRNGIRPSNVRIRKSVGETCSRRLCVINFRTRIIRDGRSGAAGRKAAMLARSRTERGHGLSGITRAAIDSHVSRDAAFALKIGHNRCLGGIGAVIGRSGVDGQGTDPLVHTAVDTAPSRLGGLCDATSLRCSLIIVHGGKGGRIRLGGGAKPRRGLGTGRGRSVAVGLIMGIGRSIGDAGNAIRGWLLRGEELKGGIVVGAVCCCRVGGGSFDCQPRPVYQKIKIKNKKNNRVLVL